MTCTRSRAGIGKHEIRCEICDAQTLNGRWLDDDGKIHSPAPGHRSSQSARHQSHSFCPARAGAGRSVRRARRQHQYSTRGPRRATGEIRDRRSYSHSLRALARRDAAWRLGVFVLKPHQCRPAHPAARPDHVVCGRLVADPGVGDRAPGRRLCRDAALFDLRPDRQHRCLCRLFVAD